VSSGWIWLSGLLNKAHRWTLDGIKAVYASSPFAIREFHSDNGSEFINKDTIDWWRLTETLLLTHSRSYHKNDMATQLPMFRRTEKQRLRQKLHRLLEVQHSPGTGRPQPGLRIPVPPG
jgi:hypothetical protein